ncbi:DUF5666 domain-containing protein [Methylobacterium dankookense]|uniref:DUF5666 domain-containing protein n=1 Tax=Methylobacterium dankookense TaxID=560405 RepID=A0ABQ4RN47_9HYPH|nr:DUF5666 domain-containing protein [Methylobacterium dankookense]GJD58176.1 hypothetical protein IFDJLNFL_4092 [Methylobacterium dankookense]
MPPRSLNRRRALRLLAGLGGLLLPRLAPAQEAPIRDQGIGGTGARLTEAPGEGDRGIGGTGVIGTIRRFGSIVVNDLRISYPEDVAVRIDGAPAKAADLRIGQVVRVVARPEGSGLATRRIDVTSEVVGTVEAVGRDRITVLGQRVAAAGLAGGPWSVGQRVAVSGLRRPDGVVVASLIEPRAGGPDRVAGPVHRAKDGTSMIGGLRLAGSQALAAGRRAAVSGRAAGNTLTVTDAAEAGLPPGIRTASIEAYIGRRKGGIALGSGLDVAGASAGSLPRTGAVRAVLTTEVTGDGRLTLERLRIENRLAPAEPFSDRFQAPRDGLRDGPRFERDRLDLRGLPGQGPARGPGEGLAPRGGFEAPRGIDTRPGSGMMGAPDSGGPGGFGGPARGYGAPGGLNMPGAGGGPGGFGGAGGFGGGGPGGGFGGGRR